jgi:hypothetical protein
MRESIVQMAQPVPRRRAGPPPERAARRMYTNSLDRARACRQLGRCRGARAGGPALFSLPLQTNAGRRLTGNERDLVVARGGADWVAMVSSVAVALAAACMPHQPFSVTARAMPLPRASSLRVSTHARCCDASPETARSRAPQTRSRERMTRHAPGWLFQVHFKGKRALDAAHCESAHQPRDLQRSHRFMRNTLSFTKCSKQSNEW